MHGRSSAVARSNKAAGSRGELVGHEFVHSAVDDHSRLAYCEVLADEQARTAVAFWTRAQAFFAAHGITVQRVLTDNGACYRSRQWREQLAPTVGQKAWKAFEEKAVSARAQKYVKADSDVTRHIVDLSAPIMNKEGVAAALTWM